MRDTIYRDDAIRVASGYCHPANVAKELAKLPSAQRTGHWIKGGEQPYFRKHFDIVVCSVCNKRGERRWNYCPNCGAKMEVEHETY